MVDCTIPNGVIALLGLVAVILAFAWGFATGMAWNPWDDNGDKNG